MATYLRGRESGGPFVFEYRLIARDGRTVWFRDSAIVLTDEQGRPEHIQGVMLDITERKIAEERIAFLAYHDKLTGLPNRTMFDELLGLALARAKRHELGVVVVTVDLDDFKLVNDSLGHEAGDAILLQFAQRLSDATRETDLVARPGGTSSCSCSPTSIARPRATVVTRASPSPPSRWPCGSRKRCAPPSPWGIPSST